MKLTRELADEAATRAAGAALGAVLGAGDAIALVGDLGAGKTTFVQGLAAGAGYAGEVTSPTFTLVHEYLGGRVALTHADLYRIERERELPELGLEEVRGVLVVEWADRFGVMPRDHLRVELEHAGEARRLVAEGTGPRSEAVAAAWSARFP
jgi:tRNA threonylcarbamoyladenosine biosynthesis protein TsaE